MFGPGGARSRPTAADVDLRGARRNGRAARASAVRDEWSLPQVASSVAAARARLRRFLEGSDRSELDTALVLVSELVANAVRHATTGTGPIRVSVCDDTGSLRIEVDDGDPTPPVLRASPASSDSGRGLLIVESLSDDWGWASLDDGKRVWCAMHLHPRHPAP